MSRRILKRITINRDDVAILRDQLLHVHTRNGESIEIERQPQKAYSPQQATGNLRLFALRERPSSYEVFSRNPAASYRE